jgi:putative ABC transport system permease protein
MDSGAAKAAEPDRELTMILVRYASPIAAASLPREINQSSALVAASPAYETARLFTVFGVGLDLVRAFAAVLVGASVLLLFVALAQALEERRYDLAILRALGARRRDLIWVLMAESVSLAAAGAVLGIALGHLAAATIGSWLPAAAPLAGAAWLRAARRRRRGCAIAGGILAACWPAWRASRSTSRRRWRTPGTMTLDSPSSPRSPPPFAAGSRSRSTRTSRRRTPLGRRVQRAGADRATRRGIGRRSRRSRP